MDPSLAALIGVAAGAVIALAGGALGVELLWRVVRRESLLKPESPGLPFREARPGEPEDGDGDEEEP